jgi:hypothetical protein
MNLIFPFRTKSNFANSEPYIGQNFYCILTKKYYALQEMGLSTGQRFSPYDDQKNTAVTLIIFAAVVGLMIIGVFIWLLYICVKNCKSSQSQPN